MTFTLPCFILLPQHSVQLLRRLWLWTPPMANSGFPTRILVANIQILGRRNKKREGNECIITMRRSK
jgi:hypothetical protein